MGRCEFYGWVWSEALAELTVRDSAFVNSVQAYDSLLAQGFRTAIPEPSWHFPTQWTKVFEACVDVEWQVRRVERCLAKMDPVIYEKLEGPQAAAEYDYYLSSFFMHCYALNEKSEKLVALSYRHFSRRSDRYNRVSADAWNSRVKNELCEMIDSIRSHLVHGEGGRGAWVTGITNDKLWEGTVAVQLTPEKLLDKFPIPDDNRRRLVWYRGITATKQKLFEQLDRILDDLRAELNAEDA